MARAIPADAHGIWLREQCLRCGGAALAEECAFCPACHEAFHVACAAPLAPCPACAARQSPVFPAACGPRAAPLSGPLYRVGATALHATPAAPVEGALRSCHLRRMTICGARRVVSVACVISPGLLGRLAVVHVSAALFERTGAGAVEHGPHVYSGPARGAHGAAAARALGVDVLLACVVAATACVRPLAAVAPRPAGGDENARPGLAAPRPKKAGARPRPPPARPIARRREAGAAAADERPSESVHGSARTRGYRRESRHARVCAPLPRISASGGALYVSRSQIAGLGLFAARRFPAGTGVAEYVGRVLVDSPALLEALERRYAGDALLGAATLYLFRLDARRVIDATRAGGVARFANHSCAPNCEAVAAAVPRGLRRGVVLRAVRDIAPGDEITFDYRLGGRAAEPAARRPARCACGARECRGTLDA